MSFGPRRFDPFLSQLHQGIACTTCDGGERLFNVCSREAMSPSLRKAVQLYIEAMHFAVVVSYCCRVRIDRI